VVIRRYAPMKQSRGTVIPPAVRLEVHLRDNGCVGARLGWPGTHSLALELDHVRAGGMGMKSRGTADNLVALCAECHRWKTEHGREARPQLIAYLEGIHA
jgi:5-methylcytosine-specific restriction endonuclease McrA